MAVNLSPVGGAAAQFFDNNGNPLTGGKLYTYAAGTTTPLATYTTIVGNVAHTNPILLDSAGRVPGGQIWLTNGNTNYKFVLENSANVLVGTYDNIPPAVSGSAAEIVYLPAGAGAVATTVQAKLRESVSVGDFGGSLIAAVNSIGASNVSLLITTPTYIADGTSLTIPSNISLVIQQGGTIQRALGGSLLTTLVLNCKTETRYGFFNGLTVTVNGPFLFFGNYDDLDTTKVTFSGSLNPTNNGLTFGNINIVSGSGAPTKMIPNNPAFPVSEICMFADLDAADRLVTIAGHGSMPPPVIPGQELFHVRKYALYTSNGSGGQNKRLDLDANATDATMWQSNTKAFLITASTNPLTTFMVGVNSPAFDTTNHIFDPSTCSAYYGGSSGIFRKDGANRDVLVVENRNGVNGDQANILYALQDTVTGNELTMAQIKVVGTEQFGPNYQAHLEFITRFQNTFKTNISMFRDSVAINNRATNSAALEISAKDDGASFLMYGWNKSQTVLSFTATSQTGALGNAAENVFRVGTSATTGRSINAGGTINASGADYAEYMEKAGNFTLAKGDVCGVDANGKLTNIFANAVSFVVKSTDPSYVGNDGWSSGLNEPMAPIYKSPEYQGSENPGPRPVMQEISPDRIGDDQYVAMVEEKFQEELDTWISINDQFMADKAAFVALCQAEQKAFDEGPMAQYLLDKQAFDAQLEERRQKVDRIAFAGQVPVNVTGATPGQYIVPSENNGSIKGVAISNPTFEQYQVAIGKVIAVEQDGRARIIVKVA